jgi:hypothetical protein
VIFGNQAQLERRLRDEGYSADEIDSVIDDWADRAHDERRDDELERHYQGDTMNALEERNA